VVVTRPASLVAMIDLIRGAGTIVHAYCYSCQFSFHDFSCFVGAVHKVQSVDMYSCVRVYILGQVKIRDNMTSAAESSVVLSLKTCRTGPVLACLQGCFYKVVQSKSPERKVIRADIG